MRASSHRLWRWIGATACLAFLLLGATVLFPPARRALASTETGKVLRYGWQAVLAENPVCPTLQAFQGLHEAYRTHRASARLAHALRPVQTDGHGYRLWDSPLGQWWFPKDTSENNIRFALAQYEVTAYPGLTIRPGNVVLDCGGYVGDWTHWALRAGAARVIIVEPAPAQVECIRRNLAAPIREGRVTVVAKGLWDEPGTLKMRVIPGNPAANYVAEDARGETETVELTTIDDLVTQLGLERLDAIKMDIEGAEVRALRGARRTIQRFRPQLAVATEHTRDVVQNNRNVIETMRQIAPDYRPRCGYCMLRDDFRRIVPETLYFYPN
ncbi:MAG: hypothetical protein KatS3mg004_3570 [Bryobacteraceae bacterium]|nr:MAG: hypothetical protein KatS3mg004_3570 [Bryobacteraceae bacterium]